MESSSGLLIALTAGMIVIGFLLIRRERRSEGALSTPPVGPPPAPTRVERPDRETVALIAWLVARATEQTGVEIAGDALALRRIADAAQKAGQELRTANEATVSLPFLTADSSGPKHFTARVTRDIIGGAAR